MANSKKFKKSKKENQAKKKDFSKTAVHIKIASLIGLFFILSVAFLLISPTAITLAQKEASLINPEQIPTQSTLKGEVAGIEKKPIIDVVSSGVVPPSFSASAVLAQDLTTGKVLFEKNSHQRLLPASTTKVMTALVAINYYKPDSSLSVTQDDLVGGSGMGLVLGEKLSFKSVLYGMLLNSGNDAAFTLASNYPGGISAFVKEMNKKALGLGLADTHFQNPAGFDDPNHYSSASDLAKIAQVAISDPQISKVVDTKETTVSNLDNSKQHSLRNVNQLLGRNGVIGIKTGYTDGAGENLVGLVDRDAHKVLTVVLASTDRFGETSRLMDWVYQNFTWKQTLAQVSE